MNTTQAKHAKVKLIESATTAFRMQGYAATSVGQICTAAEVTKGAFFHHFVSKEALGAACLDGWGQVAATLDASACASCTATHGEDASPVARVFYFMDAVIGVFSDRDMMKSCAAGTLIHEVHQSSQIMHAAAKKCFDDAELRFQQLLDDASKHQGKTLDTASLASLWIATLQGSLTLYKASRDDSLIVKNLEHVKQYFSMLLEFDSNTRQG